MARRAASDGAACPRGCDAWRRALRRGRGPARVDGTVLLLSASLRSRVAQRRADRSGASCSRPPPRWSRPCCLAPRCPRPRAPDRRLTVAAGRIAEGQFDAPVEDSAADDLGELAHELETMRGQFARLDGARKEFIANASHELRTPLFLIRGFLELLDDEELDRTTQREFIRTTREQLERLTRLALDLLELARLDVGRVPLEPEPVRLGRVAGSVVHDCLRPRTRSATGWT